MPDPSLPPPGWYGDPAGSAGSRWWDGAAWTDHVRSAPPGDDPPPLPEGVAAASSVPRSPAGRGRRTTLVAVAILVLGLVAAAVVALRTPEPAGVARDGGDPLGQVPPDTEVPAPLDPEDVAARSEAAGCVLAVDGEPLEDRSHLDSADSLRPDALYSDRPAHSGPHDAGLLPLPEGVAPASIDERAVLHNMEHGAVVVWFDRAAVDGRQRERVADWREARHDLGFTSRAGGAVFASPMPRLDGAPPVALRAWGVALDCERFDPAVADAFLIDHWGSHGAAPEADLSPYPDGALRYADDA